MTKNNKSKKGFTIVELLVVIVVIGILSAISVVSYSSLSNTAKNNAAAAEAKLVADVANAYFTETSTYPVISDLQTGSYAKISKLPTNAAPSSTNQVQYLRCGTGVGVKINYYQTTGNKEILLGTTTGTCS